MLRTLMKLKIHRATVTQADLNYLGSATLDAGLMREADIVNNERVKIYNITNGERLATYAIEGLSGSGVICINGAAAYLVHESDLVIITSFADYEPEEVERHQPIVLQVNDQNQIISPSPSSSV